MLLWGSLCFDVVILFGGRLLFLFSLLTCSFILVFKCILFPFCSTEGRKKMFLINDVLNTFYLRLYGIGHMVKDHSHSERINPLPPHGLLFPINNKIYFILNQAGTRNSSMGPP